jgi:exopolysaccharide biosynthesis polyprenyl glycosylphosphotransferase
MTHTPMGLESTARSLSRHPIPAQRRLHLVADPVAAPAASSGPAWARVYRQRLQLTDALVISVSVWLAVFGWIASSGPITDPVAYWVVAVAIMLLWFTMLSVSRTRDSRILSVGAAEYKRVISASSMTFGLIAIALLVGQSGPVSMTFVIAFPGGLVILLLTRWLWRNWLARQGLEGHSLSRVVVVGQRDDVEYVVNQISHASRAAYTVAGVVLDSPPGDSATPFATLPVSHDLDAVARTAASLGADAVVVAGPPSSRTEFVRDLAWQLEGTATDLILATGLANVAGPRIHLRPMEGLPLIHVEIPQFEGGKHLLKRAFDIAVSGTVLLVLAPVMAAIALIVRLDSPGPAFFKQERVGRDGTSFTMYKFRSMVTTATSDLAGLIDSNEGAGVLFKIKNDPRVTPFGRFMRKHSLDELPQLWNILIGDMSVVGPRPPLPSEVRDYEDHVHRRLYIRPGLTGMWQISGRSDLSWEESVKLDLYYVENWSLIGDLMIMWRTFKVLVSPTGAY